MVLDDLIDRSHAISVVNDPSVAMINRAKAEGYRDGMKEAIEIVKRGGVE